MFKQKAFTLIELLVVISIIGILAGLIAVGMGGATTAAQDSKKKATVDSIKKSLVIDKVDTGTYPIETGCTIGIDCTNLDPVLLQYLPSDLGATYSYESDGTGCTVSTILSNGHAYQYDCLTSTYSSNAPVNGACGSASGANLSSIPLTNLCGQGNASTMTGAGPWTWSCAGIYSGTTASCSTGNLPVNGACGSSNGADLSSSPSTNLCTLGTPSIVSGAGPWTWTCNGSSGGASPSCSANLIVNGACGSSNGSNLSTIPSTNLCNLGNATAVTGTGPWTWSCTGLSGGESSSCSANLIVNGACGSSNGANLNSAPSTNLCNLGNATTVAGTGPWTWTCDGVNSGVASGTCTANKIVNGVCGGANGGTYASAPTSSLCNSGTASTSGSWNWTCSGSNGGDSPACAAYQRQSCSALGGSSTTCGSTSCCRLSLSSCPAGWSSAGYTTTTSGGVIGCPGGANCYSCSYGTAAITYVCGQDWCHDTGSHGWSAMSNDQEYVSMVYTCSSPQGYSFKRSTITEIGCY